MIILKRISADLKRCTKNNSKCINAKIINKKLEESKMYKFRLITNILQINSVIE